jgi:hypothetical protein
MVLGMPTDTSLRCPGLRPNSTRHRARKTLGERMNRTSLTTRPITTLPR